MLDIFSWSIVISFGAGTLRALQLWRASTRVDVVNAVVISTLAEGRGTDLPRMLWASGSGLYLRVAHEITRPLDKLLTGSAAEVRERLERDSTVAIIAANRALRRHGWLDGVTVAAVVFGVIGTLAAGRPNVYQTFLALAASLLWLSNVRAARNVATRIYAGGTALVDSLIDGLDAIRAAAASPTTAAASERTTTKPEKGP